MKCYKQIFNNSQNYRGNIKNKIFNQYQQRLGI